MTLEEYIKPEEKGGFWIDEERKRLWYCELQMMEMLENICQKHGLNYFLLCGSAIGAVRHDGFIPWDDDLDLGMLRDDFERFRKIAEEEVKEPYYCEFGVLDNERVSYLLRIRDRRTTGIVRDEYAYHKGGGIFVEIYPFDNVLPDAGSWKRQLTVSRVLAFLMSCKNQNCGQSFLRRAVLALCKPIPMNILWKLFDWNCRRYNSATTGYVNRPGIPGYARKVAHFTYEDVCNTVYHKFEFTKLRIPVGNDRCLRLMYGDDYMIPPKMESRGLHHDNIVFYDAKKPYKEYLEKDDLRDYFA